MQLHIDESVLLVHIAKLKTSTQKHVNGVASTLSSAKICIIAVQSAAKKL